MPATLTYPGVYIEEVPSGARTISGVSTSIALFIGRAAQGPINEPVRCLNRTEALRTFSDDARFGELPRSIKLFFENGGTDCYVVRVANGAASAKITLKNEDQKDILVLTAKNAGKAGESIRANITYSGASPEATFQLELFRWERDSSGQLTKQDTEVWPNLSMDSSSQRYAVDLLNQGSRLVTCALATAITPTAAYSQSGRPLGKTTLVADWNAINTTAKKTKIVLSVGSAGPFPIDFGTITLAGGATAADLTTALQAKINTALAGSGQTVTVTLVAGPAIAPAETLVLRLTSSTGDVRIEPSPDFVADLAVPLMLGTAAGGLEVSRFAAARPAPSGFTWRPFEASDLTKDSPLRAFGSAAQGVIAVALDSKSFNIDLKTTASADPLYKDGYGTGSPNGNNDGVREKLALIAAKINQEAGADRDLGVRAEVWGYRLAILPTTGPDARVLNVATTGPLVFALPATNDLSKGLTSNTRAASLGLSAGSYTSTPVPGDDGKAPKDTDYRAAYTEIDRQVDLFNLLVLPASGTLDAASDPITETKLLWAEASAFCERRRALLIMDSPFSDQTTPSQAAAAMSQYRVGVAKNNAALYHPKLRVQDGDRTVTVGASGAIAGLMARTDATRGVWKAPAGIDADLRSIVGLSARLSDAENGVLNPRGVNILRVMPAGIVSWGARTMNGDDDFGSEWKYIPVRRLALYLEESLYRGTQWVVFEPNDEPLWSQIRLNVGAFMHGLFRLGAFQGTSPREAYFVKCDKETTTQADINRGIVNVLVGFAPLKPAEFVVVRIQQMAGQLQA